MGIKKKSRVSAEFSMSSLTDIIFLLLIFFMLTSSLIVPNALNLRLPGTESRATVSSDPSQINITRDGSIVYNGDNVSINQLQREFRRQIDRRTGDSRYTVAVTVHPNAKIEKVVEVLDLAYTMQVNTIMVDRAR
ncbi:MAG: biopolymer transporter ExbD [Saprospirales bacterium]|jgi:biopolymer transport protein ExbD|nr:MAG: biopolymer transporter ExbD [Saprospirales bacterium]